MVKPQRVLSVDVLRGLTIALMILVNDPGDWSHVFRQLDHAEWNGWTLTDLVFPTFLFHCRRVDCVFDERAGRAGDCKATLAGRIFARAGKIFLLVLILAYFPTDALGRPAAVWRADADCGLLPDCCADCAGTRRVRWLVLIICNAAGGLLGAAAVGAGTGDRDAGARCAFHG